ncbi:MAG: nucleotidyltransferase domain-containing protein [Euryarchaeota archaeon]|nr:nucleotidyltransferase domain-containing protein [Euryarchaeota archaeon]
MDDGTGRFERIVDRIKEKFEPEKVILFGSRARGDYLKDSDHDLMVISRRFKGHDFRTRIIKLYELIDEPINIDILCYTPEEFEERSKALCIVKRACEEGVLI